MVNIQRQRHLAVGLALTVVLTAVILIRDCDSSGSAADPTVPTGASFSLAVARFRTERQARLVAANIEAAGLPAFTRILRNGEWRQVVVGPYVSIDEAEAAQRLLARHGFGQARLLVDESVRRVPGRDSVSGFTATSGLQDVGVVVVSGIGRLSVVVEMADEPRQVITRRVGGTVLEFDAGPVTTPIGHQEWSAPDGVRLIEQVSVGEHGTADSRFLRTRLAIPAGSQSNVRVAGRRVYIDLWPPEAYREMPLRVGGRSPVVEEDAAVPAQNPIEEYRDAIRPVVARFGEIEPFLLSAVTSPTPDVLAAVARSLSSVEEWMKTIAAPVESAGTHASLATAVDLAVNAVEPDFAGDRSAQARQALTRFDTAAATLLRSPQ